jgi:GMP reductase
MWTGIPIVAANMTTIGTLELYKVLSTYKIITALHKFHKLQDLLDYNKENSDYKLNPDYFMISTGIGTDDYKNLTFILDNFECKFICVDIANGYISKFNDFCKTLRAEYPEKIIMAGNVCTSEGVDLLNALEIDIVKVGIGSGSCCTTRKQTGIGMPQFSAVIECADTAHGLDAHIISDGGLQVVGDFSKAYGAGADFVMSGSMFAGHSESGGELIEENGKKYKVFYGMSSDTAMNKYSGGVAKYRSSEGKTVKIEYRGPVEKTILDIQGGIRSTMTYIGAKKIKDIPKCTTFIRVNRQLNQIYNGKEV